MKGTEKIHLSNETRRHGLDGTFQSPHGLLWPPDPVGRFKAVISTASHIKVFLTLFEKWIEKGTTMEILEIVQAC